MNTASQKRPWLAAVLSTLAAGLGHIYLRRWRRAFGWMLLVAAATYIVGPETLTAYQDGEASLWALAPIISITVGAAFDAYAVARYDNRMRAAMRDTTNWEVCPSCRKDVDPSLDFCQWCATEIPQSESETPDPDH